MQGSRQYRKAFQNAENTQERGENLNDRTPDRQLPDGADVVKRELKPHGEKKQRHADIGEPLQLILVDDDPVCPAVDEADRDSGEDISEPRRGCPRRFAIPPPISPPIRIARSAVTMLICYGVFISAVCNKTTGGSSCFSSHGDSAGEIAAVDGRKLERVAGFCSEKHSE